MYSNQNSSTKSNNSWTECNKRQLRDYFDYDIMHYAATQRNRMHKAHKLNENKLQN